MNDQATLCARLALFHSLTPRKQEIAYLIGQGLRDADVAERACIQTQTVKNHMVEIGKHLGFRRRADLVYFIAYWTGYNEATAKAKVKIVTHRNEEAA
jgi:DNA-binding NarL/FixJ family response regulator